MTESPAFRAVGAAIDQAQAEFETAFRNYVEQPPSTILLDAARVNYERWKTLITLRMTVAYYEQYHVFPHSPGAP